MSRHNKVWMPYLKQDSVRFRDGLLSDVAGKLKSIYALSKATYKGLPAWKKVLFLIAKAMKLFSIAAVSTNAVALINVKIQLTKIQIIAKGILNVITLPPAKKLVSIISGRFENQVSKEFIMRMFLSTISFGIGMITEKIATLNND